MSSFPFVATSNVFNTADFLSLDDALTIETANKLYLSISYGGFITGITAGVAQANKALVLDGSLNIAGINQVSSSYLKTYNTNSTLITSSSNGGDYGLHLHSILASSNGIYSGSSIAFNNSSADQVPLSAIYLDKIGSGNGQLVFATRNGATCDERMRLSTGLTLNYVGTGLDTPSLKFSGTTFNQTYYLNMIEGTAEASKAIVLNSSRDISNINAITTTAAITTNFTNNTGSLLSYQQWSNTVATPINVALQMSSSGTRFGTASNHNFRIMSNNGIALFCDGSQNVAIGTATPTSGYKFDCTGASLFQTTLSLSNLANKTLIRTSTITSSGGIELYDTQFNASTATMLNFLTGNDSSPNFMRLCSFSNNNTGAGAYPSSGCPFQFDQLLNVSFDSGFRMSCINASQATNQNANLGIWSRNFTIPHFIAHDQFNQAMVKPTSTQINTQITGYDIVLGGNTVMDGGGINECRGNSTVFSMRNTTGGTADRISYIMEHGISPVSVSWEVSVGGTAHPVAPSGMYWYSGGNYRMNLTSTGRLGIGATAPRCGLEVGSGGSVSQTTIGIGTNTFSYNVFNNTYTNHGGGPFSYSVCAWFNGNIYVSNSIYNASDRRLKENIKTIDIELEHYKKINPVSYNYKNDNKQQLGFIAQEMKDVCGEAVSYVDNENLKVEADGDIEGVQMNIDYKQISVMNCAIIKKLIDKIEKLEKIILDKL